MTITTTQKIIKIGSSKGVTLPAKQLQYLGLSEGDLVQVTVAPVHSKSSIQEEYAEFKQQYEETLKNLGDDGDKVESVAHSVLERYNQDFKNLSGR